MKSGTAAYQLTVETNNPKYTPRRYEGYNHTEHNDINKWLQRTLKVFTDIYGTVVDAHYNIESAEAPQGDKCVFYINIIVTAITDSEVHFDDQINDMWTADLREQLSEAFETTDTPSINYYDTTSISEGPLWSQYRT